MKLVTSSAIQGQSQSGSDLHDPEHLFQMSRMTFYLTFSKNYMKLQPFLGDDGVLEAVSNEPSINKIHKQNRRQ